MRQQTAKLLYAVGVGVGASLAFTAMPASHAAAAECLAAPKGPAPAGSHWFYRTDHATKRNCWYVRAKNDAAAPSSVASTTARDNGEAATAATTTNETASADPALTPATSVKPTRSVTTPLRSAIANARAEVQAPPEPAPLQEAAPQGASSQFPAPLPTMTATSDQQAAPATSATEASAVEQRWADAHASDASAAATADNVNKLRTAAQAAVAKGGSPAAAAMATAGSAATLIAALLAALALAGLIVGGIFKFGRREPTIRRDINGRPDIWSTAPKPASSVIAGEQITQDLDLSPPMQPVEPPAWIQAARRRQSPVDDGEEIEQLLARAQNRPAA